MGETDNVEPLIGLVLTKELAEALVTPNNVRSSIAAIRKRLTVTFLKGLGSSSIRAYRLTSLDLLPSLIVIGACDAYISICMHRM